MTSRERVVKALKFEGPDKLPCNLFICDDMEWVNMEPYVDGHPVEGIDWWGCEWENIGTSEKGEVKNPPLTELDEFFNHPRPALDGPGMWAPVERARADYPDLFLMGMGISLYERIHLLLGLEETWMAIAEDPEMMGRVVDDLVDMNIEIVEHYAAADYDGLFLADDWGLQNHAMISPESWTAIWQPRYARLFKRVHELGMHTFLHSCGYIVDIMDGLIEAGLDAIQMDQQENMGLDLLHDRFAGRITFHAPVDIQRTMVRGNPDEIRAYCRDMVTKLGTPKGGFIAKNYPDRVGAGHTEEATQAMMDEFVKIREAGLGDNE